MEKTWNLQSIFQASLFKIYTNNSDSLLCYIYIINSNTDSKPNWPWISLLLPGNNLENTWNFVSQEKWEPCMIYFNTFRDFHNKNLYKSTRNLVQKTLKKTKGLGPKTLRIAGIWYLEKSGNCVRSLLRQISPFMCVNKIVTNHWVL